MTTLKPCLHDTTGCQTGLTTVLNEQLFVQPVVKPCLTNRFDKHSLTTVLNEQLNEQLFVQLVVKLGCTTGLATGLTTGCIVYTNIYPVVKPLWQQVVSCKWGLKNRRMTDCIHPAAAKKKDVVTKRLCT